MVPTKPRVCGHVSPRRSVALCGSWPGRCHGRREPTVTATSRHQARPQRMSSRESSDAEQGAVGHAHGSSIRICFIKVRRTTQSPWSACERPQAGRDAFGRRLGGKCHSELRTRLLVESGLNCLAACGRRLGPAFTGILPGNSPRCRDQYTVFPDSWFSRPHLSERAEATRAVRKGPVTWMIPQLPKLS
ncbi:hypothetical protein BV20DRAFT_347677 [Pilatotrama ljubarskyi]|nr:hypothetical protein BV20DRAFT_347677 [Pilatotrama ljubarskyi]